MESAAVHPSLVEAVGGNFQGAGARALAHIGGKRFLQFDGIGRGIGGGAESAGEAIAHGAHDGGLFAQSIQSLGDPVRHGSFAVGAGDADEPQFLARLAIHVGSDCANLFLEMHHCGIGHAPGRIPHVAVRLPQHAGGAAGNGLGNEVAAVARRPRISGEHHPGSGGAAVGGEFGSRRLAEQMSHGFVHHAGSRWTAFCVSTAGGGMGSSGATLNSRSAAPITWAKTGAATRPP